LVIYYNKQMEQKQVMVDRINEIKKNEIMVNGVIINKINNHDLTVIDTFIENINPKNVANLTHTICTVDEHTKLLLMILDNDNISDYKKLMFFCFVNQQYFIKFINKLKYIPYNFINQRSILCCYRFWCCDEIELLEQKCDYDDYIKFVKCMFERNKFLCSLENLNFVVNRYYNGIYQYEYFNRENEVNSFLKYLYYFCDYYYLKNDKKDQMFNIPDILTNIIEHIKKTQILNNAELDIIKFFETVDKNKHGYIFLCHLDYSN